MGLLKRLGVVALVGTASVAALSYKPASVPISQSITTHATKWNPQNHHIMTDAYEIKIAKDSIKNKEDDMLVVALKAYFLATPFKPQEFIMRRTRDEKTATTRKEIWEIEELKREHLKPGSYLYDHFGLLEVNENTIWYKMDVGALCFEVKENNENSVVVRISSVLWNEKENKPVVPLPAFYLHLLYQRLLMQSSLNKL